MSELQVGVLQICGMSLMLLGMVTMLLLLAYAGYKVRWKPLFDDLEVFLREQEVDDE